MELCKIALNVDHIGLGSIVVNGVDLSRFVQSTRVFCRAGELTRVELDIPAAYVTAEIEAALRVYIIEDKRDETTLGDEIRRVAGKESDEDGNGPISG